MHPRNIVTPFALLVVLAVLALAACGPGTTASSAPVSSPSATTSEAPTASASPSAEESSPAGSAVAGDVTVMVADSEFGEILVDGEGMVLYGFVPDEETGETTCYDDCAAAWPPLLEPDEVTVGDGLDDSDFSLIDRTDGAVQQVKVGGWPLYYFAGDEAPGDTNGQGLQDVWYVVSPEGELIGR